MLTVKRGEVWWVNFEPSIGGEIRKKRPAVIVSNDPSNRHLNRVQVVPLSSKIYKVYPSEAPVTFLGRESKAMADQLATVSKERLLERAGELTREGLRRVEDAIRVQLGLT
jgi:mRNA interferase MazF